MSKHRDGGLQSLMADLAAGRVTEDPFPVTATERLQDYLRDITQDQTLALPAGAQVQKQPVGVLLLGGTLKAMGDPDANSMVL